MTPLIDLFLRRHHLSLPFIVVVDCCRNCLSPLSCNVAKMIVFVVLVCRRHFVVIVCLCNWPLLLSLVSSISFACSLFLRSFARLLVCSFVYSYFNSSVRSRSLYRSFAPSLVRSFTCLLVRSLACSLVCLFELVRLFARSLVCSFARSLVRSFAPSLVRLFACLFVRSFACSLVHLFIVC